MVKVIKSHLQNQISAFGNLLHPTVWCSNFLSRFGGQNKMFSIIFFLLLNACSGDKKETTYDLCIIGAGFFGSAAARHASANSKLKICLIGLDEPSKDEYADRDIFSSFGETRITKHLFDTPAFQKLATTSIKQMIRLKKYAEGRYYRVSGYVDVGKNGTHRMRDLEDVSEAVGTSLEVISDHKKMRKTYSFVMAEDEYGLLDLSSAGYIKSRVMLQAQRKAASDQGCFILYDEVKEVEPLIDDYHVIATKNNGNFKSKRVLFTTGAFTNVNKFKVLPQLEMYVLKEMSAVVRISDERAHYLSDMASITYKRDENDTGIYIYPPMKYPDGRFYIEIGSLEYDSSSEGMQTKEEIKEWFLSEEVPGEAESMAEVLFKRIPDLKSEGEIFRTVSVSSRTPTGYPYIDQVEPTVTVAAVGNFWGATTSDEIGRLAAHLSLTGKWASKIPKSLFKIVRKEDW